MLIDYILDTQIYPERPRTNAPRTFAAQQIGDAECLTITRADATTWLMFCHGNMDSIDNLCRTQILHRMAERCQCNVFAPEYPPKHAHGSDYDTQIVNTFKSAYTHVHKQANGNVHVMGHSLGVALALACCNELPPKSFVLTSGFASIRSMAPSMLSCVIPDRFNNVQQIQRYTCPILIFHGSNDQVIPCSHAETCAAAAQHGSITLLPMGHTPEYKDWSVISGALKNILSG